MRVLLVDDDQEFLTYLQELLHYHNFDVMAFSNAEQAIGNMYKNDFNLILTDIQVPTFIDGFNIVKHAKKIAPSTPIISMSGLGISEIQDEFFKLVSLSSRSFSIKKPFKSYELIDLINDIRESSK